MENARAWLREKGFEDRIREFDVSSATVALAAQALGCEEQRIAKSITFLVDGGAVMVVTAGDAKIDNGKFKAQFGAKAKMLTPDQAVELVGHAVGGVCPFGVKEGARVYLDVCLRRFDTVYPAAGSANSAVKLTPDELEQCADPIAWIDVCKLA